MEYEIEDESMLFDSSTNPSLEPERHVLRQPVRSAKPQGDPADKRAKQKAEIIPEEELIPQMG